VTLDSSDAPGAELPSRLMQCSSGRPIAPSRAQVDIGNHADLGAGHPALQAVQVIGTHDPGADHPDPDRHATDTQPPMAADSIIASSAVALRTASSRVLPWGVPSAMDRRKLLASITLRSSYPMLVADPGWNAA